MANNKPPRQAVGTWRLVVDFTDEQVVEYRQLMGATNNSAADLLELMRIGKSLVDGYVHIEQPEGDWKSVSFKFDKAITLYKAVKECL